MLCLIIINIFIDYFIGCIEFFYYYFLFVVNLYRSILWKELIYSLEKIV